jgi:glycine/D-amino acid oxidase-like deaminating enzyme
MSSTGTIAADVAIVGAGIVGVSTALELLRRGKRVVVLERWMIGAEASSRNAGGVRQQGRAWQEMPMAKMAVGMWQQLDASVRRPSGYLQCGHVYVAENQAELDHLGVQRSQERQLGLDTELIDGTELRRLAPGINPVLPGAKFCPTDGVAEPARATSAIAAAAEEEGATILCHTAVTGIGQANGRITHVDAGTTRVEAPVVLDAAGPWAPYVAQMAGVYLPIFPSRLASVRTKPMPLLTHVFVQTFAYDFGGVQYADFSVRVGSGADKANVDRFTFDRIFHAERELAISDRARYIFPALAGAELVGGWAGTRECTPDMMPIMGPVGGPDGFFVAAGFSGHGFCIGPAAGRLMAEWIVDGTPSLDLSAFSWRRFMRPEGPLTVVHATPEQAG